MAKSKKSVQKKTPPPALNRLRDEIDRVDRELHALLNERARLARQVGISKTEPGDENNQDISSLVGKVDIRKLEAFYTSLNAFHKCLYFDWL